MVEVTSLCRATCRAVAFGHRSDITFIGLSRCRAQFLERGILRRDHQFFKWGGYNAFISTHDRYFTARRLISIQDRRHGIFHHGIGMSAIRRQAGFVVDHDGCQAIGTSRRGLYFRLCAGYVVTGYDQLQRFVNVLSRRTVFAVLMLCHGFVDVQFSVRYRQLFQCLLRYVRRYFYDCDGFSIEVALIRLGQNCRYDFAVESDRERYSILRLGRGAVWGERYVF